MQFNKRTGFSDNIRWTDTQFFLFYLEYAATDDGWFLADKDLGKVDGDSSCMLVGGCRVRLLMRRNYCTLDWRRFGLRMIAMLLHPSCAECLLVDIGSRAPVPLLSLRVSPQWLSGLRWLWRPRSCRVSVGVSFSYEYVIKTH